MKKWKPFIITILLALVIGYPVMLPSTEYITVAEAATVKLSKNKLTLTVGTSKTLKMNGTTKKVTWKSSKKTIASVTSTGKILAKAPGVVKITAAVGSKNYICVVTVKKAPSSASAPQKNTSTSTASSSSWEHATGSCLNGIVKLSPPADADAPLDEVKTLSQLKERITYLNNHCKSGEYNIELSGFAMDDTSDITNIVFGNETLFGSITYFVRHSVGNKITSIRVTETKTLWYELARGFENEGYLDDVSTTAKEDAKAIYPIVKDILLNNIQPDMSDYEKEKAIHDYLVNHFSYDQDFDIYTIRGFLQNNEGVCQAYADTFQLLMNLIGIQCITQSGIANGVSHAWNIVLLDGEWYNVDVTWDDPISTKDILRYDYFNITDKQLSKDHIWTPSEGISATATKYAYKTIK